MSHRDVYVYEMRRQRFPNSDVERVLAGQEPENEALARLAPALVALHRERPEPPSDEAISRLAAEAAAIARSIGSDEGNAASPRRGRAAGGRKGSLRRRLATLTAALLTFAGMTGIALAADSAAPGDPLYGLDRALEQIGINDGATSERIEETKALAANGRVPAAFRHLAESVETEDEDSVEVQEAADALRDAAEDVGNQSENLESRDVRNAVATMLDEIAGMAGAPEFDGAAFGQRVAEMARAIPAGENAGHGDGPPEDAGAPGDTGAPEDTGPPEHAGPPEDAENTANPPGGDGPPEDVGSPESPGPPAGTPKRP